MNTKRLKTICLIMPGKLPVPAISGGAVETLITLLADQNEVDQRVRFVVISSYAQGVEEVSREYQLTDFYYIKTNPLARKFVNGINYLISITTGNIDFFTTPFHWKTKKLIKTIHADAVVVEHGVYKHFGFLKENFDKKKIFLHIHGAGSMPDPQTEATYGNVITVSSFVKNEWKNKYADQSVKFYVCKNGIDERHFAKRITAEEREHLRSRMNVKPDDLLILYCGRLTEIKGVRELVKAVLQIKDSRVRLMLVGASNFRDSRKSSYEKELCRLADGSAGRIFFTGYIDNRDLYQYYQIADIQVIPSLCEEGAGLVGIEGMLSGLPLIATNSGGIGEYLGPECSLMVDKRDSLRSSSDREKFIRELSDCIAGLCSNSDRRVLLGKKARQEGRKFTRQAFYQRFVDIVLGKAETV